MLKRRATIISLVLILIISSLVLFIKHNLHSISTSGSGMVSSHSDTVPLILCTQASESSPMIAHEIEYNIVSKRIEDIKSSIFTIDIKDIYNKYQWYQNSELTFFGNTVNGEGGFNAISEPLYKWDTKIYKLNDKTYTACLYSKYPNEEGIVFSKFSQGKKEDMKINLKNKIKKGSHFSPLLVYGTDNNIRVLVHYDHPVKDNSMESGLSIVNIKNNKVTVEEIDMKGQRCVNYDVAAALVGNDIYANLYDGLGKIDINKKSLCAIDFYNNLKKIAKADSDLVQTIDNQYDNAPLTGCYGDILLLSYGYKSKYYIWGVSNEQVVFTILVSDSSIFDGGNNKIGSLDDKVKRVVLPNVIFP